MSNEGGVIFDCKRINEINTTRRRTVADRLLLLSDYGCKPMADVILHTSRDTIHCAGTAMQRLEMSQIVKYQDWMSSDIYLEAIPERLTGDEISNDRADMIDGCKESFPECFK